MNLVFVTLPAPIYGCFSGDSIAAQARAIVSASKKQHNLPHSPCCVCGAPRAVAHHEDYSQSLYITWLCRKHHSARHKELRWGVAHHPSPSNSPIQSRIDYGPTPQSLETNKHGSLIGRIAECRIQKLIPLFTIKACKEHFGRTDVLISPIAGSGSKWVRLKSLTLLPT